MNDLPGRITTEMAAEVLGFSAQAITILVAARLLRPLGNPAPNSPKYFSAKIIRNLAQDAAWLDKATRAEASYWKRKNKRNLKNGREAEGQVYVETAQGRSISSLSLP